jgi:hypothetical protein
MVGTLKTLMWGDLYAMQLVPGFLALETKKIT